MSLTIASTKEKPFEKPTADKENRMNYFLNLAIRRFKKKYPRRQFFTSNVFPMLKPNERREYAALLESSGFAVVYKIRGR